MRGMQRTLCKRERESTKTIRKKMIPFLLVTFRITPSLPPSFLSFFFLLRVNKCKPASYISPSLIRAARAGAVPSESAHFKKINSLFLMEKSWSAAQRQNANSGVFRR